MNQMWENLFRKSDAIEELQSILKSCYIFQDLSRKELSFVKELIHVRHYKNGEAVFKQGEIGVGMYIIGRGTVDIMVEDALIDSDEPTHVTRLSGGDFLGELSLVEENSRRSATALSVGDSMMIGFFRPDLEEIIERNPSTGAKICFRLSQVLGRRLKGTSEKVTELKKQMKLIAER